jgi:pimeloyl-ACP methyl ester carboxylesterase
VRQYDIEANGISLHVAETGQGPAVLFCHGFPAIWSSWKSTMQAVANAGFRAIAFDLRGYGMSSAPAEAAEYSRYHTVGDAVAVLAASGARTAVIVGHDWGANVAWNAAMMRPDLFTAICGMSVLFRPPGGPNFLQRLRDAGKHDFYMFAHIRAEADQEWADASKSVPGMMYWSLGEAPEQSRWDPFDPSRALSRPAPSMPRWVDAKYLQEAIESFNRTGFRGAMNYYRAIDLFDRPLAAFAGAKIGQPSMFLGGALDGMNLIKVPTEESIRSDLKSLRSFALLDGVGHWPQLEAPEASHRALIHFLKGV